VRPRIALVTSGVGTRLGGIGIVAELIATTLEEGSDLVVWEHHAFWPRFCTQGENCSLVYDVDLYWSNQTISRMKKLPSDNDCEDIHPYGPIR
jgi:hypothetical protein